MVYLSCFTLILILSFNIMVLTQLLNKAAFSLHQDSITLVWVDKFLNPHFLHWVDRLTSSRCWLRLSCTLVKRILSKPLHKPKKRCWFYSVKLNFNSWAQLVYWILEIDIFQYFSNWIRQRLCSRNCASLCIVSHYMQLPCKDWCLIWEKEVKLQ